MEQIEKNEPPVETTLIRSAERALAPPAPMVLQLGNSEQTSGAFSFSLLATALRQRLWITIPLGIVFSAAACAALYYLTEDKYSSTAMLEITDKHPYLVFNTNQQSKAFADTQIELLKSRFIIQRAHQNKAVRGLPEIRALQGKEDPILWISQRLKVQRIAKSNLYNVTVVTRDPKSAKSICEAIVNEYTEYEQSKSEEQKLRMMEVLEEEKYSKQRDVELKRAAVRELAQKSNHEGGIIAEVTGGQAQPGKVILLTSLQSRLYETEYEINEKEMSLTLLQRQFDNQAASAPESHVEGILAGNSQVLSIKAKLTHAEQVLPTLKKGSQAYSNKANEIDELKKQLEELKGKLRPEIQSQFTANQEVARKDLVARLSSDLEVLKQKRAMIDEQVKQHLKDLTDSGESSVNLEFARAELAGAVTVRDKIAERFIQLKTESRAESPVRKVADPQEAQFPDGPSLSKKLVMVGFGGLAAPFLLFAGWDLLYRRVYEREQLQREVKVKFVSEIAALPVRPLLPTPGSSKGYKQQSLLFEESVNSLRTTLSVDRSLQDCQVFVLASAVSGEGKTNLSSQLAMSWAQAEPGKVILVDADLRAPNVHDLFEVQPGPGLAEVLRGECSLEEATVMDWGDRLYILPAGDLRSLSASQLFSGSAFLEVLAKLRSQYRKIVIDVPPVLCASEALLIAKQADAVLMCALHDYSRAGQVKQAYERLQIAGVNVVGAVLNGTPVRRYSYAYRGYGYGMG